MRTWRYLPNVTSLRLREDRCVGCGLCLEVCPHPVLEKFDGRVQIVDRDACMECGACARNCPVQAIMVNPGVGCAAAIINTALGRTGDSCCCLSEPGDPKSPFPVRGPGCC